MNAETGSLMLFDSEGEVLTIKKAYGLSKEIIKKTRIKKGESNDAAFAIELEYTNTYGSF